MSCSAMAVFDDRGCVVCSDFYNFKSHATMRGWHCTGLCLLQNCIGPVSVGPMTMLVGLGLECSTQTRSAVKSYLDFGKVSQRQERRLGTESAVENFGPGGL